MTISLIIGANDRIVPANGSDVLVRTLSRFLGGASGRGECCGKLCDLDLREKSGELRAVYGEFEPTDTVSRKVGDLEPDALYVGTQECFCGFFGSNLEQSCGRCHGGGRREHKADGLPVLAVAPDRDLVPVNADGGNAAHIADGHFMPPVDSVCGATVAEGEGDGSALPGGRAA